MGTDSDRTNLLEAMFLSLENDGGLESFGFYRSKEGRELLRQLFSPYLRRQSIGEGKAATIIADSYADPRLQAREVDRTKSALRRWCRDGQGELWPKDQIKNSRCLHRLENEYLSVQELREILEDTAETLQKHHSGIALANFFYGPLPISQTEAALEALHTDFEGLYDAKPLLHHSGPDPFELVKKEIVNKLMDEVRKFGVAADVIHIDSEKFDFGNYAMIDTREPSGYHVDRVSEHKFVRLRRVDRRNFMLVQIFQLAFDSDENTRPRDLSSGYAFPMADGTLHMFMVGSGPLNRRTYVALSPNEVARPTGTLKRDGDRCWSAARSPFPEVWESHIYGNRPEFWQKFVSSPMNDYIDVDKLNSQLDRTQWNLLP